MPQNVAEFTCQEGWCGQAGPVPEVALGGFLEGSDVHGQEVHGLPCSLRARSWEVGLSLELAVSFSACPGPDLEPRMGPPGTETLWVTGATPSATHTLSPLCFEGGRGQS